MEKSTAHALLDFDEMHSDLDESKETSLSSSNVSENESSEVTTRMTLRSSRKN